MSEPGGNRLDGWKQIASYLQVHERTVVRWEKQRGLPVHRVPGGERNAVVAFKEEIDAWLKGGGHRSARRLLWPVGIPVGMAAAVVVASLAVISYRRLARPGASVPAKPRPSVAVLVFKNLSGKPEEEWVSTALRDELATELAAGEKLRAVPGEDVARLRAELSLPDADGYSKDTLARVRRSLGADYVVSGSYFDLGKEAGGRVRFDLRLRTPVQDKPSQP